MRTNEDLEKQVDRLRHELERERREHRDTLALLDAVTIARNNAEAKLVELALHVLETDHSANVQTSCAPVEMPVISQS